MQTIPTQPKIESFTEELASGIRFRMIKVDGSTFMMGSEDENAWDDEKPVRKVKVNTFWLGEYLVTQGLWRAVMGKENNPSGFTGVRRPVERVSWNEVQEFIHRLNEQSTHFYRLPNEAEWEFAARGGKLSQGYLYSGSDKLEEVAWYAGNSHRETKDVGLKYPNELGLYDMSGNVDEWVEDQWHGNYDAAPQDGSAWLGSDKGAYRVFRGGGWNDDPRGCRVSSRNDWLPDYRNFNLGFRLACSSSSES